MRNLSPHNLSILDDDIYAPILKEYVRSLSGTRYESLDLETGVPFTFPQGLKLNTDPEATKKGRDFESIGYVWQDEVNGVKRYIKPRICRYADMKTLHPDLRVLHITYCHGFKHESYKALISISHFAGLLEQVGEVLWSHDVEPTSEKTS